MLGMSLIEIKIYLRRNEAAKLVWGAGGMAGWSWWDGLRPDEENEDAELAWLDLEASVAKLSLSAA